MLIEFTITITIGYFNTSGCHAFSFIFTSNSNNYTGRYCNMLTSVVTCHLAPARGAKYLVQLQERPTYCTSLKRPSMRSRQPLEHFTNSRLSLADLSPRLPLGGIRFILHHLSNFNQPGGVEAFQKSRSCCSLPWSPPDRSRASQLNGRVQHCTPAIVAIRWRETQESDHLRETEWGRGWKRG